MNNVVSFAYTQEVVSLISTNQDLRKEEKEEFVKIMQTMPKRNAETALKLFKSDPRWVSHTYGIYKAKIRALKDKNMQAWNMIIKEEISQIESYAA